MLFQDEGVFFLRLNGVWDDDTKVEDVIVVDSGQRVVRDCVEEYDVNMDPSVLDNYVGDDARFCAVTERKQFDVQLVGK